MLFCGKTVALFFTEAKCHSFAIKIWSTFENFDSYWKNKKACKFLKFAGF